MTRLVITPLFHAAFLSVTAVAVGGKASTAAPPESPLSHPISTAPRTGDGPTVDTSPGSGFRYRGGEPPLPLSKVQIAADGSALYSQDVNRILCTAADSRTQRTWLGSASGLKLVDGKTGTVRHYSERDGLPAGRIAALAAAPSGEAWCVVQGVGVPQAATRPILRGRVVPANLPRVSFHLCAFQPASGKWTPLRTITPTANPYNRFGSDDYSFNGNNTVSRKLLAHAGRPRIVVQGGSVTFTLGAAMAAEKAAAYQWDRKAKNLRTLFWETGFRADNPLLFTTFSAPDVQNGGIWIGTNVGLLHHAVSAWSRVLSDQAIGEGSAASGGGVWVVTAPRPASGAENYQTENSWSLYKVSGTGANQIRDISPPRPPAVDPTMPRPMRQFGETAPNTSFPIAVTADAKGGVWLTQRGIDSNYGNAMGGSGIGRPALDAWWRRTATGADWTRYEMRRPADPSFGREALLFLRETTASGTVHDNVSLSLIPDAAVLPLALSPPPRNTTYEGYTGYSGYTASDGGLADFNVAYWVRRRFPAWICDDDLKGKLTDPGLIDPYRRVYTGGGPIADPYGPEGMVWVMDLAGTALLHLPKTAMPENLRQYRAQGAFQTSSSPAPITDPRIERYPLPPGRTIQVSPAFEVMVTNDSGRRLFLATQGWRTLSFDTATGAFTRVPLPQNGIYPSRSNPPIVTSDGDLIVSSPNGSDSQALRYSPDNGSFRVIANPGYGRRIFGVAPNGGFWIATSDNKLHFQAPGETTPTPLPDDIKSPRGGSSSLTAAVGFIAWSFPGNESFNGYDIERKRRTPAIDLRNPQGYGNRILRVVSDNRGGIFVASENNKAAVYHYDRERDAWEGAAPPLPLLPAFPNDSGRQHAPMLVSANEKEFWLFADGRCLIRFDRAAKSWEEPLPLPASLRAKTGGENDLSVALAENGEAFYLAGQAGLWRYSRRDKSWTEKKLPVSVPTPDTGSPDAARVSALAVSPDSVFTVWTHNNGSATFAARLDRKTKEWTVYDESKGFPERASGSRLIATGTGSAAWLIYGGETYFFDAKQDRWRHAFGRPANSPLPVGDAKTSPDEDRGSYRVVDVVVDPKTGDSFVLANPERFTDTSRSVVFRCDGMGKIIARATAPIVPEMRNGTAGNSLLADKDSVLIAATTGVFRAFVADSSPWERLSPPTGISMPTNAIRLQRGLEGRGLYVLSGDSVSHWAKY